MRTLGIIGGAGPMATAYFMEQIIGMTEATTDQEHIRMLVDNNPMIPDRTKYILDNSAENPGPVFLSMGRGLVAAGAEVIAIPCITASYFIEELQAALGVPVVDTIGRVADFLVARGVTSVGLMATDGTLATGLFQKTLEASGISVVLPDQAGQQAVMSVIYDKVKAGIAVDYKELYSVRDALAAAGAELSILGCTELSVAAMDDPVHLGLDNGFLDAMAILAQSSIKDCGGKVKIDTIQGGIS